MVFRFTTMEDLEMLRELIRQKPFAAKRGSTLEIWDSVAAALGSALKKEIKVKQIRDRLNLLKTRFKEKEQLSALASGVEESIHAVNVQTHYTDVDGLIREYTQLERLHHDTKAAQKISKEKKEEDLAKCAAAIVDESRRRRAYRDDTSFYSDSDDSSDAQSVVSGAESTVSTGSSKAKQQGVKRSNAYLTEIKRQDKKYKEQLDLKHRELEQGQKQFEERLEFEKKQAEDRLQFEQHIQQSNREMILECAKIFGAALAKK
ncbi:hypothetical protein PPTG_11283 [Phytophthora nicotianae INRA-310]|uniref:Uncharacterized protein n=2 Tax=Phytophthora nicotianae TaxID=4792 RepID=W2Q929_PHYN3|nr:hypothetical protein PPTG_11283 [Phytophthora nicotianae INRA-310]KUF77608.1 hypothetical protein AM587_10009602 [Phytophthora nicotianae]ETN09667.1 hypothetical protein PPTG_11283 [Phytophthora nicotianae INRA-310]KUF79575.1 hypothetical protein AM587_10016808 [Phytophthora nicotianae]KUF89297.1 hypothetical protein AM587_10007298 [Phytophthora nicotianae]KUF95040.1 hypothetical protein AM587_10014188 [Phytophthora nicotianae]